VKIRGEKLRIMKEDMDASDEVRLKYASTYAQVSNYWKYFIGQTEQLKRNKVWEKKKAIEDEFSKWVNQSEDRKKEYGSVLKDISEAYEILTKYNPTRVYFYEALYSLSTNQFMISHSRLYNALKEEKKDEEKIDKLLAYYGKAYQPHFESVNYGTELKLVQRMFQMYLSDVPANQLSDKLKELLNIKALFKYIGDHFSTSIFTDQKRYEAFINNPNLKQLEDDKLFNINIDVLDKYRNIVYGGEMNKAQKKLDKANRLFVKALLEMNSDKKYYPNANSTLRLSYGNVMSYRPKDGVIYDYYTTIDGLMAKEDKNNPEFTIPKKLKELYAQKDYGRYGQDGTLRVNFISNNDITGGNSGSPVMNKKGHLIGCAFDGNWEAMSGDIAFEDKLQRTISVDIRYILFVIDKYAGATNLIEEMTIID
jgi:uncharacterized protein (UPF0332 family)